MSPVQIGTEIEIVDEVAPVVAPTATDPAFLIHSDVAELATYRTASAAREALDGSADLVAMTDAYFAEGGAVLTVVPLVDDEGPDVEATLAQVPADLGPGQVVAPEVNDTTSAAAIAEWAWATNRIYIADAAAEAIDDTLEALGDAIAASDGGRAATVVADTLIIPGAASGITREVPASIVLAALIARSDRATGNPGLAAAGLNGQARYVIGIDDERDETRRNALAEHGVISFRTLYGSLIRAYGFRTAADPTTLPLWWDLSGSRVVMAFRARADAIAEDHVFGQIDREGNLLAVFGSRLAAELADLQRIGAIYGTTTDPGYTVASGWEVNPPEDVATGRIRAVCRLRTSPFAEFVTVSIIRRPTDQEV